MSFVLKTALPIIAHGPLQTLLDATKSPEEINRRCSSITFVAIASPSLG